LVIEKPIPNCSATLINYVIESKWDIGSTDVHHAIPPSASALHGTLVISRLRDFSDFRNLGRGRVSNQLEGSKSMLLSHILGIIGELLNLIGAILLAIELFMKRSYREEDMKNSLLHDLAVESGLDSTYIGGIRIADPGFQERMAEQRAKNLGFAGAVFLTVGFGFLVAYHVCEMIRRC
jgi:hypothetical protein